jgi:hypothetical protein
MSATETLSSSSISITATNRYSAEGSKVAPMKREPSVE